MRLAHVTATFPPYLAGTGNVAYSNALALHERGHSVTVLTARPAAGTAGTFPFRVEYLNPLVRLGNAPFAPALLGRLRHFDLVHLHYPFIFGAELTAAAARLAHVPYVLTYHNRLQEEHVVKQRLFAAYNRTMEPLILSRASGIISVRRNHLLSLHPDLLNDSRVREVSNTVDTERFYPQNVATARAKIGIPIAAPVALFAAALDSAHRFKDLEGLLRAFARLESEARLLIVGDGNRRPFFERMAVDLGLGTRARFFGSRQPHEMPAFLSAADVTVLPSNSVESFGLVLIESMACATPVIATSLPGVRDLVESEVDGLLVSPRDEPALAEALRRMLANRRLSAAMGVRGRAKVEARYSQASVGNQLERVYAEVLLARGIDNARRIG